MDSETYAAARIRVPALVVSTALLVITSTTIRVPTVAAILIAFAVRHDAS
jgi:hypothetical protein